MRWLRSRRDDVPDLNVVDLRERLAPYVIDERLFAESPAPSDASAEAPDADERAPVT
jgi:hypothetical protein